MDLFSKMEDRNRESAQPLAVRMRPGKLEEFVGQEHFIGKGKLLWRMLQAKRLTSLIFFGPPGTGKTTLAHIIARHSEAEYISAHAAATGVREIREIIKQARDLLSTQARRTVLFLDEIHRFNRSQQDVLLDDVENGTIILIGATTENPYFSVNSALVSRSSLFEFLPLSKDDIKRIIRQALADRQRGLGDYAIEITEEALDYLALMSDGDARRALTAVEVGVYSQISSTRKDDKTGPAKDKGVKKGEIDNVAAQAPDETSQKARLLFDKDLAIESIQQKSLVSDRSGDNHFDLASALQKSMRGSDPDATVYWLARLIAGGEDPRFIARRIAVCAAEDVGNADPVATILAAAAVQISEFIGLPEAQLPLAQAAIYIACAPKSNSCSQAIWKAVADVRKGRTVAVPEHLRDGHYAGAKKLGRAIGYKYPHEFAEGYVKQEYLPGRVACQYYKPTQRGRERQISEYLAKLEQMLDK